MDSLCQKSILLPTNPSGTYVGYSYVCACAHPHMRTNTYIVTPHTQSLSVIYVNIEIHNWSSRSINVILHVPYFIFCIQYSSFNRHAATVKALILQQLGKIVPNVKVLVKGLQSVCTPTIVIFPDLIPPTPLASSAVQTPDPQSPGPSVSLVQTKKTPENIGHWMPLNQQLVELSKQNTTLISCTARV